MKYAVIARPPAVGGTSNRYDQAHARSPASSTVIQLEVACRRPKFAPLGGVAVIATQHLCGDHRAATRWRSNGATARTPATTSAVHEEECGRLPPAGHRLRRQGDADAALAGAAEGLQPEYYQPHMAHTPMEPPVALADVARRQREIWAPVQTPYGARVDVAELLGCRSRT